MDIESAAIDLGKQISKSPEYKYYTAAAKDIDNDAETTDLLKGLKEIEEKVLQAQKEGNEISEELKNEYTGCLEKVQSKTKIQSLLATQENYMKLMNRVNELIAQGIHEGEQSRIITNF